MSRKTPIPGSRNASPEGWHGWDEYAPFYDWENRQTLGRRDVPFWRDLARRTGGPVLELGCGTGRVTVPVARVAESLVGIDRSAAMLARARRRVLRARMESRVALVRGDIRALPFGIPFQLVMAPYGILQSLIHDQDLEATLQSVSRVLASGGTFGLELVSDLPGWEEYRHRKRLSGKTWTGAAVTLIESVRQDRRRGLTYFDQAFVERHGQRKRRRSFSLVFRTLPVQEMMSRLERTGFTIRALLGDYDGGPWDPRAEAWIVVANRI